MRQSSQRVRREIVDMVWVPKTTPFPSTDDSIPTGEIWNFENDYDMMTT